MGYQQQSKTNDFFQLHNTLAFTNSSMHINVRLKNFQVDNKALQSHKKAPTLRGLFVNRFRRRQGRVCWSHALGSLSSNAA